MSNGSRSLRFSAHDAPSVTRGTASALANVPAMPPDGMRLDDYLPAHKARLSESRMPRRS